MNTQPDFVYWSCFFEKDSRKFVDKTSTDSENVRNKRPSDFYEVSSDRYLLETSFLAHWNPLRVEIMGIYHSKFGQKNLLNS